MYDVEWARRLQVFRNDGDPLTDDFLSKIYTQHGLDKVHNLLKSLVLETEIPDQPDLPELMDYVCNSVLPPIWFDDQKIKGGANFYAQHSIEIVMMLFTASLPTLYAARQGAEVLAMTKRMVNYAYLERRIYETAQFILDVTDHNAFTAHGSGIKRIQKVRLVHGIIRFLICHDPAWADNWQPSWGMPINQVELVGTMLSFSVKVIQAMERAGLVLRAADKENYLHLWKVVGYMLGIREELMPKDYTDAVALMSTCELMFIEPSPTGRILADVLVRFLREHWHGIFPSLITDMIRQSIGKYTADALGLPDWGWTRIFLHLRTVLWFTESILHHHIPLIGRVSRAMGQNMIKTLMEQQKNRASGDHTLPPNLRPTKVTNASHRQPAVHVAMAEGED